MCCQGEERGKTLVPLPWQCFLFSLALALPAGATARERKRPKGATVAPRRGGMRGTHTSGEPGRPCPERGRQAAQGRRSRLCNPCAEKAACAIGRGALSPRMTGARCAACDWPPAGGHKAAASGGKAPAQPEGRIQNAHTPFRPESEFTSDGPTGPTKGGKAPQEEAQPSPTVSINLACLARARAFIYLIIGTE